MHSFHPFSILAFKFGATLMLMIGIGLFAAVVRQFIPNLIWVVGGSIVVLLIIAMVVNKINKNAQEEYE